MKLVKYLFFVGLTSSILLSVIYFLYHKGYNKYHFFQQEKIQEEIEGKTNYNILFLGSSRTYVQVDPRIIDSITGLNSYNAGINGANLLEINLIYKCFMKSHPQPQMIALDLSRSAFDIEWRPVFDPNIYYPYLHNKIVFEQLRPYEKVYLLKYLPFTRLAETDDYAKTDALYGWLGKKEVLKGRSYKGYQENGNDTIALPFRSTMDTNFYKVGTKGKNLLEEIIADCKKRNIKLLVTYAPEFYLSKYRENPEFFATINEICSRNKIPFKDYRNQEISRQNNLFANPGHLNKKGAAIYSAVLAQDLKSF